MHAFKCRSEFKTIDTITICRLPYLVELALLREVPPHVHLAGGLPLRRIAFELHDQRKVLLEAREAGADLHFMRKTLDEV